MLMKESKACNFRTVVWI